MKLTLDFSDLIDYESYLLITIKTSLEIERLAYKVNEYLCCRLQRKANICMSESSKGFSAFSYEDTRLNIMWHLVSNKSESDVMTVSDGFFSEVMTVQRFLNQKSDALMLIEGMENLDEVIKGINKIEATRAEKYEQKNQKELELIIQKLIF